MLADSCLSILHNQLKFNICNLPSSFIPDTEVPNFNELVAEKIGETLAYSCIFWGYHLFQSELGCETVERAEKFLETQGVFWIEAMSILKLLHTCGELLEFIKVWINWLQLLNYLFNSSRALIVKTALCMVSGQLLGICKSY
ncbi:hypothetical protein GYMLUDRAFT_377599 [Collybiopsis luxurians FD-317 M1]|uniref:Uncharacterized protein n=1 Tax=Collybiopsis luxurians FD-317 M1 TaxID=944289 RepID=A0A0D0C1T5_9AGAR|nr:hypothetical protein GYMLUDRAFT_377599 [Collybiopsis luxurians FD-317 M1]